ncbi:MAG: hypothetical protein JO130_18180 [Solirubrobacterales bacterium]|nr:hypothetical protein [Solirubrobacterales bacterium]
MAAITFRFDVSGGFLDLRGQRAGFVLLAAFLITFLFIRTSARLMRSPRVPWWPGSVTTESGLHLHHLVWGIVLLLLSGFLGFALRPPSPFNEIFAAGFGVGAGLTLDEFALWVYLRDVYWADEGRSSFDAVVIAALIGGLIVLGAAPFDLRHGGTSVSSWLLVVVVDVALGLVPIIKGKPVMGVVGVFFWPVSVIGAIRLASPSSRWARRRYRADGAKLARSRARWARIRARRRRISDLIAGAPEVVAAVDAGVVASTPSSRAPNEVWSSDAANHQPDHL